MELFGFSFNRAELTAWIAIAIAAWSARTAHRTHNLAISASKPAVSTTITPLEDHPGWWQIETIVVNRSDHILEVKSFHVWWPFRAKLMAFDDANDSNAYGEPEIKSLLPADAMRRSIPIHTSVSGAGKSRNTIYLFRPGIGGWIWLRLRLAFSDSTNSRMAFSIRRLL